MFNLVVTTHDEAAEDAVGEQAQTSTVLAAIRHVHPTAQGIIGQGAGLAALDAVRPSIGAGLGRRAGGAAGRRGLPHAAISVPGRLHGDVGCGVPD